MSIEQMYQDTILDYYAHPVGKGLSDLFDVEVHHINTSCGDEITLRATMADGVIESVTWDGVGCSISMASMSIVAEMATGKPAQYFTAALTEFTTLMHGQGAMNADEKLLGEAVAFVGVAKFPARVKCALLGWKALEDAVNQMNGGSHE